MQSLEYVAAYPDKLTPDEIYRGPHSDYIRPAQEWSSKWGRFVHGILRDDPMAITFAGSLEAYTRWYDNDLIEIAEGLEEAPPEIRARALNELNFHFLNNALGAFVPSLTLGVRESPSEHKTSANTAQLKLAIDGLALYEQRTKLIKEAHGTHVLFEPEHEQLEGALTGVMQEDDAGIVLLEFVRQHPNLVLLPAPLQFERMKKRFNVDYLVIDIIRKRAVGVQVKSRLRQDDANVADPERVVLLDGDTDLGNVRMARIKKDRSTEKLVPWPGIIAAKKMETFQSHGEGVKHISTSPKMVKLLAGGSDLARLQLLARELVGDIRVDYKALAATIGARILRKL